MLWRFTKKNRLFLLAGFIGTILATVFNYLTPQVVRITVDSIIGSEPFNLPVFVTDYLDRAFLQNNLYIPALFALAFSVLSGVFTYFYRLSIAYFSEGTITSLRQKLYRHIGRLSYAWHVDNKTGDIIQRCTSDVETVRGFVSSQFIEVFRIVFLVTFSLVLMFGINSTLTFIALAFIPIVLLYSGVFYGKIAKNFKKADEAEGALSAMVQENFTGVRVVRAFGRQSYEIEQFNQKNNAFANLWIKLGKLLGTYWAVGDLVSGLQVLTIVILGTLFAVNGSISLGEFLVFVFYNSMLVWPVRSLGRILSEVSKTGVSLERLNEILIVPEEDDNETGLTPNLRGDIVFKDVSFDYSGKDGVLRDINLEIKAGSTIGILGGTGSGKSTLMYLLTRLYEQTSGSISIGGVDIKDIRLSHLRQNIGFVLQEPFLFSKTIKENIGIAVDDPKPDSIHMAAQIAAVHDNILGFEKGYDTIVGERGVTLSGGQKQRVAIARMLIGNTPIKIFDDSLSAVDTETDIQIRNALKQHMGDSTVILISHRITTLMNADQIIVLDGGRISEQGTHEELIRTEGIYKRIYDIQGMAQSEIEELIAN